MKRKALVTISPRDDRYCGECRWLGLGECALFYPGRSNIGVRLDYDRVDDFLRCHQCREAEKKARER